MRALIRPSLLLLPPLLALLAGRFGAWPAPAARDAGAQAPVPALESLGAPVPGTGIPSTNLWAEGGLLYMEAVDGTQEADHGPFVAYDLAARRVVYSGSADIHTGFRCIAVDRDGNAYFSVDETGLARYDPRANAVTVLPVRLSESLRAATRQAADGWIYGATNTPDNRLFRFHPATDRVEDLGTAWAYTASLVLDPSERYLYWVPDAHGAAFRMGTPLLRFDIERRETVVEAFLNGPHEARRGFRLGGTYALDISPDGRTLFINMNAVDLARDPAARAGFGDPALLAVHLPDARTPTSPAPGGIRFRDVTEESGLGAALGRAYLHTSSWGDVDGDGRPDLVAGTFVQAGAEAPSTLLLNRGGRFVDAAEPALAIRARGAGSVLADLDGDHDLDLYLSNNRIAGQSGPSAEPSRLFRNDGGRFTDVTPGSGVEAQASNGRQAGVLDFDADGDLDLFVVADALRGRGPSVLLRNEGGLRFSDATAEAGLPADIQGLGLAIGDVGGDGRPDLFVAGGPKEGAYRNYLFLSRGAGRFERADDAVFDWRPYATGGEDWTSGAAMGDVNRDGRLDLAVAHHFGTAAEKGVGAALRLYLNRGPGAGGDPVFEDVTAAAGLPAIVSKAPHVEIGDFDDDGWPDLYASVAVRGADGSTQPLIFRHLGLAGGQPRFASPALTDPTYYAGGPVADVDRDGRLDVFLADWRAVLLGTPDEPAALGSRLYLNEGGAGHWLDVRVTGANAMGIGAQVSVYRAGHLGEAGALLGMDEVAVGDGFSGSGEARLHFGLGADAVVDVAARLPSGADGRPGAPLEARAVAADRLLELPLQAPGPTPTPFRGLVATAVSDSSPDFLVPPPGAALPPHRVADEPPTVDFVPFPRPDHPGNPWSQWGALLHATDGRVYAAIGDHLGRDGNAFVYAYDPATRTLASVGDIQTATGHQPGAWGHGKIHSRIDEARDGHVYMTSYWGSRRNLVFDDAYQGSVILRYPLRGGGGTPAAATPAPSATAAEPSPTSPGALPGRHRLALPLLQGG